MYERFGLVACARIFRLDGSIDAIFTPDHEDDEIEVLLQLAYDLGGGSHSMTRNGATLLPPSAGDGYVPVRWGPL